MENLLSVWDGKYKESSYAITNYSVGSGFCGNSNSLLLQSGNSLPDH